MTASGTLSADNGAVYDRGSDQDATYMHFNPLFSLVGTTINGDVNLNLTVNDEYGGAINNGIIGTATSAWTTTSETPGITTFTPVAAPNANLSNGRRPPGQSAMPPSLARRSWLTLPTSRVWGLPRVPTPQPTLALWPRSPAIIPVARSGSMAPPIGAPLPGTSGTKTLYPVTPLSGDREHRHDLSWASHLVLTARGYDRLPSAAPSNQTLSGAITGTGALAHSGNSTLTLNGSISYKGGTTVTSGTLELPGGDWNTGDPWGSGGAIGAITVGSGAILSTSNGVTGIKNGLTLNGGTVSSRGLTYPDPWGNLFCFPTSPPGDRQLPRFPRRSI